MSEQIVREASAWQGTIEGDYRESAQNFAPGSLKVFIRQAEGRFFNSVRQAFGKVAPKLTNI